jgi:hypothetical protein
MREMTYCVRALTRLNHLCSGLMPVSSFASCTLMSMVMAGHLMAGIGSWASLTTPATASTFLTMPLPGMSSAATAANGMAAISSADAISVFMVLLLVLPGSMSGMG